MGNLHMTYGSLNYEPYTHTSRALAARIGYTIIPQQILLQMHQPFNSWTQNKGKERELIFVSIAERNKIMVQTSHTTLK